jgi:hypothetical protein
MLIVLLSLVSIVVGVFFYIKNTTDTDTETVDEHETVDEPETAQAPSQSQIDKEKNRLLEQRYNNLIEVAKKVSRSNTIKDHTSDCIVKLIDSLWEILEPINNRYPSEDVTYRINRMASGHLTEMISDFSEIDNPTDEQHENLLKQIENMQKGVDLADDALESDDIAKFNATVSFLEGMHGKQ